MISEENKEPEVKVYYIDFVINYEEYASTEVFHKSIKDIVEVSVPITKKKFLDSISKLDTVKNLPRCNRTVNFNNIIPL